MRNARNRSFAKTFELILLEEFCVFCEFSFHTCTIRVLPTDLIFIVGAILHVDGGAARAIINVQKLVPIHLDAKDAQTLTVAKQRQHYSNENV